MDQTPSQTPRSPRSEPDTVSPQPTRLNASATLEAHPTLSPLLSDAVRSLHLTDAAGSYKASVAALRQTDGAAAYLAKAYQAAPQASYLERWSVATVLGDLQRPDALNALRDIAVSALPKIVGDDATQAIAEETMIRVAAVEGIAGQASRNPDARAVLLESAKSPVFSVRRAAAQAFLARGGARADVEKILAPEERFILDLKTLSATDLPSLQPPTGPSKDAAPAPGTPNAPAVVPAPDAPRMG